MLTRSIDRDPFGPTIEEKIFLVGKRVCIVSAVAALSISALDLMNVRAIESASEFIHHSRLHSSELPGRILAAIRTIDVLPDRSSVTVAIPRDAVPAAPKVATAAPVPQRPAAPPVRIAAAPPPSAIPVDANFKSNSIDLKSNSALIEELAAARHLDAIEFAMITPSARASARPVSLTVGAVAGPAVVSSRVSLSAAPKALSAAPSPEPIILASIDPGSMQGPLTMPEAIPVALPMAAPIPLDMVPMPVAAPGVPPPSPAQRLKLDGKDYTKAERCLANAVYWESRSEPVRGQMAVAQVVLNRVFSPFYPNDVCSVVYQNASRHLACQFTFACDGKRKVITERGAWARANRIAKQTLDGKIYVADVAKSTHYHATYVHPYWAREMKKLVRHGIHNFYRPYAWGNGADAPSWGSAALAENKKK